MLGTKVICKNFVYPDGKQRVLSPMDRDGCTNTKGRVGGGRKRAYPNGKVEDRRERKGVSNQLLWNGRICEERRSVSNGKRSTYICRLQ